MADVKIRIIGEDQASRAIHEIDRSLGDLKSGLGDTGGNLAAFNAGISDLLSTSAKLAGGAAVVGATMKAAFDLGAQGASVMQTEESFSVLLQTIGAAPDLLNQLREASRGTVPDLELMSATATLLAGTSGELALQLASAAPEILEIAKAANKLNPTLGDTTFLYESLMTGIKRGSPLLIDNTGLTLKLGEANEMMAEKLGKSVEELTAEEQRMAILNATLEAGDVLINQVGGSVDSQTDSFARLNTATENLSNTLKAKLSPFLADAANALLILLTMSEKVNAALDNNIPQVAKEAETWDSYTVAIQKMLNAAGFAVQVQDDQIRVFEMTGTGLRDVTDKFDLLDKAAFNSRSSISEHTSAFSAFTKAAGDATYAAQAFYNTLNMGAAMQTPAPTFQGATAPYGGGYVPATGSTVGASATIVYNNYGISLQSAAELQNALTPIVQTIINGR